MKIFVKIGHAGSVVFINKTFRINMLTINFIWLKRDNHRKNSAILY